MDSNTLVISNELIHVPVDSNGKFKIFPKIDQNVLFEHVWVCY